jgi:signal transduction histidine kinase
LHISSDPDEFGDGEIVFEITDNGPGIHLEEGENLFTPFFTKKEAGTGLGLTIVHRTVAAHRGSVRYGNRPEGGARFVVCLPIDPSLHLESPGPDR